MDADAVCEHLFTRIPSEHFHSPMLGFEFVQFCRDHLLLFGSNLDLLRTSFPNLFKARELGLWGSGHPCSRWPVPLGRCARAGRAHGVGSELASPLGGCAPCVIPLAPSSLTGVFGM